MTSDPSQQTTRPLSARLVSAAEKVELSPTVIKVDSDRSNEKGPSRPHTVKSPSRMDSPVRRDHESPFAVYVKLLRLFNREVLIRLHLFLLVNRRFY